MPLFLFIIEYQFFIKMKISQLHLFITFIVFVFIQGCSSDSKNSTQVENNLVVDSIIQNRETVDNEITNVDQKDELTENTQLVIDVEKSIIQESINENVVQNQTVRSQKKSSNTQQSIISQKQNQLLTKVSQTLIPLQRYEVKINEGAILTTSKGMNIEIPKDCFVDRKGRKIKGKVDLLVKEYYSAGEIIMSNLPMYFFDGKSNHSFESDGMFTITGTHKNKPAYIAKGKAVKIDIKRNKTNQGYDFYKIENGQWKKDQNNTIQPVANNSPIQAYYNKQEPQQPIPFDPNLYTEETDVRYSYENHQKEANPNNNTVCQWSINVIENPWVLDQTQWNLDKKHPSIILKKIQIEKTIKGKTFLKDTIEAIFYQRIYATRGTKKYQEALAQYEIDIENYKIEKDAFMEKHERLLKTSQAYRSQFLLVSAFGSYNIDRYYSMPQHLIVEKEYNTRGKTEKLNKIFLLVKSNDGKIIPIDLTCYPNILRFNKREKMALIAMSDNDIYSIEHTKFHLMLKNQMDYNRFRLDLNKIKTKNSKDFDKLLTSLF